ncbi:MAG: Secretion system C-terminal sorting domain, partial [Bacteroidota bacterium]
SSVNSISDIYSGFNGPLIGLISNMDLQNFNFDWFYYISSTNPAKVDSTDANGIANGVNNALSSFPTNGTIFRFAKGKKTIINGQNEVTINPNVSLYPNLVATNLNVKCETDGYTISIFDMSGKLCLTQKLISNSNQIDVSNLLAGNYLTAITNGFETNFYKIVKQ